MTTFTLEDIKKLEERLASLAHEQWSGWMKYLFSKCVAEEFGLLIPDSWVRHWKDQVDTKYNDLPEHSKESDRKEARAILKIIDKN